MITINMPESHTEIRSGFFHQFGGENFNLLTVCGDPQRNSIQRIGHAPNSSSENFLGDRSCFHENVSGVLYRFSYAPPHPYDAPFVRRVYIEGYDSDWNQATFKFTHVLPWGVPARLKSIVNAVEFYVNAMNRSEIEISYLDAETRRIVLRHAHEKTATERRVYLVLERWSDNDDESKRYAAAEAAVTEYRNEDGSWPGTVPPDPVLGAGSRKLNMYLFSPGSSAEMSTDDLLYVDLFCRRLMYLPSGDIWGDLSQIACEQAKALDINSIAYVRDLLTLKSSIQSTISTLRGKITAKTLADLELSLKYGVRQTYLDTKKVLKSLHRQVSSYKGYSICRSMKVDSQSVLIPGTSTYVTVTRQYNLKCYYDSGNHNFANTCRELMSADIFPSLQNAWDLIPFSFCLDWFVDVESLLNRIDTNTFISVLDVASVIQTSKIGLDIDASMIPRLASLGLSGTLNYVVYDRQNTNHLTVPTFRLDETHGFNNFVELGAIIVQKKH